MRNILIALCLIFLSCNNNQSSLKETLVNRDDYWAYYDELDPGFHGIYYKFEKNGKSDRYCKDRGALKKCSNADIQTKVSWVIVNDSVLKWGNHEFDIVTCNKSVIVLYMRGEYSRHFFLIKEFPGKLRKGKAKLEKP